jgi:Spy/CpxP family protein refolding chaperone
MITFRSMSLPLLALVAALAGCTQPTASSSDDVAGSAVSAQTVPVSAVQGVHHADRVRGGSDYLVRAALRAPINLSAQQRATIEGLVASSAPKKQAFDTARASARATKLAAAVRSNSFDAVSTPAPDASKHEARMAARAAALQTLHDTLTAEQRTALVANLRSMPPKGAADHTWKSDKQAAGGFQGKSHDHGLYAGLNLTQEQKDAIKAKLGAQATAKPSVEDRKAHLAAARASMQAKLDSFASDSFDAKAFVARPQNAGRVGHDRTNRLAVLVSVLTPEQREILATRIEQGPARVQAKQAPAVTGTSL